MLLIRIRIRIGSGFNGVPGSGFATRNRVRIQEGKKDPEKEKTLLKAGFSCSLNVLYEGLKIAILDF